MSERLIVVAADAGYVDSITAMAERLAVLDWSFLVFVALSTVVAAIGLIEDNVAVVIGAMLIAPLLGPNLAFALGVALGDRALMGRAMGTNAAGVALTLGSACRLASSGRSTGPATS